MYQPSHKREFEVYHHCNIQSELNTKPTVQPMNESLSQQVLLFWLPWSKQKHSGLESIQQLAKEKKPKGHFLCPKDKLSDFSATLELPPLVWPVHCCWLQGTAGWGAKKFADDSKELDCYLVQWNVTTGIVQMLVILHELALYSFLILKSPSRHWTCF